MLYLDMDGVLMDFDGQRKRYMSPWESRHYHHLPKTEWTEEEKARDAELHKVMAMHDFWTTMRPMPDAYVLWTYCRPLLPHVLTATPNNITYRDRCATDKANSIRKHFDPVFPQERFHAVLRSDKSKFAYEGHPQGNVRNVLVDDHPANCAEWEAAGGTAIIHHDALTTIRKLQELYHG